MHALVRLSCCSSRASEGTCWACSACRWMQQQVQVIARPSAAAPPPEKCCTEGHGSLSRCHVPLGSLTKVLLTGFSATTPGTAERSVRMNSNCILLHLQDPYWVQSEGCQEQHVASIARMGHRTYYHGEGWRLRAAARTHPCVRHGPLGTDRSDQLVS